MAQLLYRIGRAAYLHRWKTAIVWLLIIVGISTAAINFSQPLANKFTVPGLESVAAQDTIKEGFNTEDDAVTSL